MAKLGRGVDPLEVDLLGGLSADLGVKGLAESQDTLLGTGNRALDNDKVVLDLTVADETTETVYTLVCYFLLYSKSRIHTE